MNQKAKLIIIGFMMAFIATQGQTWFGPQQIIISDSTAAKGASSVFSVDIDGDGDMDVLSASRGDSKIAWYENKDGKGAFSQQRVITYEASGARSVFAADIDNDGDIDVLSASEIDNKIAWYENTDGHGTFGPQQIISIDVLGAASVYAVDIDGDGDMDILSASSSYNNSRIAWHENLDSNGNFGPPQDISSNISVATCVFACDIDCDGDIDVLSALWGDNKIVWYENTDGNGVFGPMQVITSDILGAKSVFATDIDSDGDMDVLSASMDDHKIAWYENDGNGDFGSQQIITTALDVAVCVFSSDIDGDGDPDVIAASQNDDKIVWFENIDGNGTFGSSQMITNKVNGVNSIYVSDVDGDGDMDVLSASALDSKIAWFENTDGEGAFGPQQAIVTNAYWAISVFAADIDGDGDKDVLSATMGDGKIAWYENTDGKGTFGFQRVITTNASRAISVYATDIDGDGDIDVLSASRDDNKIAWYKNTNGNGTFGEQQVITTLATGATSVYAADIDGDGDVDILSSSYFYSDSKIAWYENIDGMGTFGPQQVITSEVDSARSVFAADIDNDGDIDVLSASIRDNKIAWYENIDGHGAFGPQQIISFDALGATSVYAADIDGDGDMDVLSASSNYYNNINRIAWYENIDSNGNFGPQQDINSNISGAIYVFACDIDCDGDIDVLSASWGDNKIAWYENTDGNGVFGPMQVITSNVYSARSVYATDIDGDGDMDVLSASFWDNKIAWYENMTTNGIETISQNAISIYPNPTTGKITLDFAQADIRELKITNLTGKILFEKTDVQHNETFDLSGLPSGIYILNVRTDNGLLTRKVVKD